MPFKSLTDLGMRINVEMKKKSVWGLWGLWGLWGIWGILIYMTITTDFDITRQDERRQK